MNVGVRYCRTMASQPQFDWHLADWMASLNVSQADLCRATGFPKAKMSELVNGVSRYNRDVVNVLAKALNLRPYELLMHPDQAHALRRQREDAMRIVEDTASLRDIPDARKIA